MTGLRRNTISELESGQSYPDWSTIARLAYDSKATSGSSVGPR